MVDAGVRIFGLSPSVSTKDGNIVSAKGVIDAADPLV